MSMATLLTFLIFFLGASVGSFLNVVISRLATGESILRSPSHCPLCGHRLGPHELIPLVSFVVQRGRCRSCGKRISWQYPLVELTTSLVFLLLFLRFGLTLPFLVGVVSASFLLVIFVYDLKHQLILDRVTIPAIVFGLLAVFLLGSSILSAIVGGAIGAGFFALQYAVSKGRWIGGGDIRLGAFLGVLLGWEKLLLTLLLAYVSGALVATALVVTGAKRWGSQLAFGTFLAAAGFVSFLVGDELIRWYLDRTFGV